jgi:hypothetical protein
VFNTNVNEKSKIFLTMNGPIGSQYWISKKEKGLFEIKFEKPLDSELPFDYLIYNLKDKNSPISQSSDVVEHTDKITTRNTSINTNQSEITTFNINNGIPPIPAEPEKSFIFENGVIKPNPFFKISE